MSRTLLAAGGAVVVLATAAAAAAEPGAAGAPRDKVVEINITNDLTISSGEPQIAVDPTNRNNLVIIETDYGSAQVPAYTRNPVLEPDPGGNRYLGSMHNGRLQISADGGDTWTTRDAPAYDPYILPHSGGGDAMVAIGPDGTIYVADCTGAAPEEAAGPPKPISLENASLRNVNMFIAASSDGGKTFTAPQPIQTPRDRPWLKVDESTGTVYTASTGPFDPKTKEYNVPGPGAPFDRWLTAWRPHLTGHSEARRLGGPDFSASRGSTMSAANGVLAVSFVIDGPEPPGRASVVVPIPAAYRVPVPVPASLRSLVHDGTTTCSPAAPCLFFETSADEGLSWKRRHIPTPGGISGVWTNVAADPGRPGRYAVLAADRAAANLEVFVTDDFGDTWSAPATVPQPAPGRVFKFWMDYGPTGVLAVMWKKERPDVSTPPPPGPQHIGQTWGAAFDVYTAISCDGGTNWGAPLRVNAETSPSGPNGFDDLSYIAVDDRYAHLVWGDRRNIKKVKNAPTGIGGVQAYYARAPFSITGPGGSCGRR